LLLEGGALNVYAFCTHGVFSGSAPENIKNSVIKELVVCNTLPLSPDMVSHLSLFLFVSVCTSDMVSHLSFFLFVSLSVCPFIYLSYIWLSTSLSLAI
jgi:hypothetical protein